MKVPFKPVWTEDARRFVDQVKSELGDVGIGGGVGGGRGRGGGAAAGGLTGGILAGGVGSGLGAALGIGGIAAIAVQIVTQFKSLISVGQTILKVLLELLRPIADVVTLLLLPVLSILRPILMIVKQIMAPFRQAALQLSGAGAKAFREGNFGDATALFGLSLQTGISGLQAVVLALFSGLNSLVIKGIGELLAVAAEGLFGGLVPGIGDMIRNAASGISEIISGTTGVLIEMMAENITLAAENFGVILKDTFLKDVRDVTETIIAGEDNSVLKSWRENMSRFRDDGTGALQQTFGDLSNGITNLAGPGGAIDFAFNSLIGKIKSKLQEIGNLEVGGGRNGKGGSFFNDFLSFIGNRGVSFVRALPFGK